MGELADVYDGLRREFSELVRDLDEEDLSRSVPATPAWTIKDVTAHLAGDATFTIAGDYPKAFFQDFAAPDAVEELNAWTDRQIRERRDMPLEDILAEWEKSSITLTAMMRGEQKWPEELSFPDRVMITDATVHLFDVLGALGRDGDRNSAGVKLASSGYVGMIGFRIAKAENGGCLKLDAGEKTWIVGGEKPDATVRATRFEFFRALSGRRSPEQIRAYEWEGDPDPFIAYFYPYGIRAEALYE